MTMVLGIIWILFIIAILLAFLPSVNTSYNELVKRLGKWSIVLLFIFYIAIDAWIIWGSHMTTGLQASLILMNISGIIVIYKTGQIIK